MLRSEEVLRLSKAGSKEFDRWRYTEQVLIPAGETTDRLIERICKARIKRARSFRAEARGAIVATPPMNRICVNRSYYYMYHTFRAISFLRERGDNFDDHKQLPQGIPTDFPDRSRWQETVKEARLQRNSADYDIYPVSDSSFAATAQKLMLDVDELYGVARQYLRNYGVEL